MNRKSELAKGNQAFREGNLRDALAFYERASKNAGPIENQIRFNIDLIKKRIEKAGLTISSTELTKPSHPSKKLPATVLIVTWDIGHNPLGRSYMLAEILKQRIRHVILMGFQFPRYGSEIWKPVRNQDIPIISIDGKNLPEALSTFERIAQHAKPDLVIACKPRLPSILTAEHIRARSGCPVIIDIDDHELSFFGGGDQITPAQIKSGEKPVPREQAEPYADFWTRFAHSYIPKADAIITSNSALKERFGGHLIPHARDESTFDPNLYDKISLRKKYGLDQSSRIVLFFGTPRAHKGITTLARAVASISDKRYKLLIVGAEIGSQINNEIQKICDDRAIFLPPQPFSKIPEIVALGNVVCLLQDEGSLISQYQLPAKAIDAIAMNIPLLVTDTRPLRDLVENGVAQLIDPENPSKSIINACEHETHEDRQTINRNIFLEKYSYKAIGSILEDIIKIQINKHKDRAPTNEAVLPRIVRECITTHAAPKRKLNGKNVAIFWKQNDTTIYGRRHDMVIKYLSSREDIDHIFVFDHPISEHDLISKSTESIGLTHDRLIYTTTYQKLFGALDTDKVSHHPFIAKIGKYKNILRAQPDPLLVADYIAYVENTLQSRNASAEDTIFWIYPKNYILPEVLRKIKPSHVVTDLVDDHRTWPNISPQEAANLTENYKEILERTDLAIANCSSVQKSLSSFHPNILLIPNGCDTSPPSIRPSNSEHFSRLENWPGKIIGFVGNLESKIDIPLIRRISEELPDCLITLVGSTHANPKVRELEAIDNILMPGPVPYAESSAWIKNFDVAIVPHLRTSMTDSMNPLKVYVYAAHGVPIVATNVANIDLNGLSIETTNSHSEFLKSLRAILNSKDRPRSPLNAQPNNDYASANSWESRFSGVIDNFLMGKK